MRRRRKRQKLNNKGLTLIEMVVAIAIIGIFSTVVMNFITSGANFYRKVSITAKLQSDMQTTLERIENAVMDTNLKMTYTVGGTSTGSDLNSTAAEDKQLLLESVDQNTQDSNNSDGKRHPVIAFEWAAADQKLYYASGFRSGDKLKGIGGTSKAVLTENVSEFQVDISKAKSEGIVLFRLTLKKGDKEISQLYTVTLRNKVSTDI